MFLDVRADRLTAYTKAMAKGMADKLFFLPFVPQAAALLDFGCADGRVLAAIAAQRPDLTLAGYDCSAPALQQARTHCPTLPLLGAQHQAADWVAHTARSRPVFLLASSVLHEVAYYGGPQGWADFWTFTNTLPFSGIAIRDFSLDHTDAAQPAGAFGAAVRAGLPTWQRDSFEALWGPITTQGRAVHAALKAPWTHSWDREGPEDYFPTTRADLATCLASAYTATLWHPHIHTHTQAQTLARFGHPLPCPTHIKVWAERH